MSTDPTQATSTLEAQLAEAGMAAEAAALWASFVAVAMVLTRLGEARLKEPHQWTAFLRKLGHRAIAEDDISVELYHAIDAVKNDAPLGSGFHRISVERDAAVPAELRTGTIAFIS